MTAHEIISELARRGVALRAEGDRVIAKPLSAVPPELREAARQHKAEIVAALASKSDPAGEALAVLARLRGYVLPDGRIEAARLIVERLRPMLATPDLDPAAALGVLQAVQAELTALGGAYDPELADAIGPVNRAFPGAQLVKVQ